MSEIRTLLILIPALPLAAALLTAVLGKRVLRGRSHLPTVAAIALSFVASVLLVVQVRQAYRPCAEQDSGTVPIFAQRKWDCPLPNGAQAEQRCVVRLWTWANIDRAYAIAPGAAQGTSEGDSPIFAARKSGQSPARKSGQSPQGSGGQSQFSFDENGTVPLKDFRIEVALRADPLTAVMLATVTLISLLVAVYSIGYMHADPGYWRFFTYVSLFVFSMTMLVSVSNFVMLYVFWEAVGLCSYLLIGFWFQRPAAAAAGKKAFLVNRIGDLGFALGVFLLWTTYGTLDFHDTIVDGAVQTMGVLGPSRLGSPGLFVGGGTATAICLLLFLGACGKSAQFPLHVWLPDAMEGPTPVSALIHAATMVTAGVYLVARCAPLFAASVDAQCVVATIGGLTALLGALIAITQTDLKRILAYSTVSQLGYMFLGLGAGSLLGITAGMFHLCTHAFFKALLFLAAGSVMHAMGGVIDLRLFGGLRRLLPVTHWTFLFGCLALAGIFPWAGFWSKDAILDALWERASAGQAATLYFGLYAAALAGAFFTALYAFRAYFLAFFGEERIPPQSAEHARESPRSMTGPLVVLAVAALVVGACFAWTGGFAEFLARTPSLAYVAEAEEGSPHGRETGRQSGEASLARFLPSQAVALTGIALAALLYLGRRRRAEWMAGVMDALGLYQLSRNKFYLDQLYAGLVVLPARAIARLSAWLDSAVLDELVDLCGRAPKLLGAFLRPLQNGMIQFYALAMVLGLLVLIGALMM